MSLPTPPSNADHYCFIIHAAIPYCYDINAILALPAGFNYRNRFDAAWVEPNLRGDIGQMRGKQVLIILREKDQNKLIPVRWGKITLAERIGRVYYFEYTLGDLIRYPEDDTAIATQISGFTASFGQFHNWLPGRAGQSLGNTEPAVFRSAAGQAFGVVGDDDTSQWGNTVAAVVTAPIYNNTEFIKILGLQDLRGTRAKVVESSFVVKSNTVYQLRVAQTIPVPDVANLQPHDIELITFSDQIVQLRPKQRAVGKYDVLNYVLKTKRLPPGERSALEIPHIPHHQQGSYAPGALYMPVVATGRSVIAVLAWTIAVLFALVVMFKPELFAALDATVVRNVATVVFVLLVSGVGQTLSALFPSLPWSGGK